MSRYIDADNAIERLGVYLMTDAQIEYGGLASEDIDDWKPIAIDILKGAPSIDIVRCAECVYYDPPHVEDDGKRIEYKDLPKEAFDKFGTGLVNMAYGVNVGGRCCVDYNCGYAEDKRVYRAEDNFCSKGRRPLYSSEREVE